MNMDLQTQIIDSIPKNFFLAVQQEMAVAYETAGRETARTSAGRPLYPHRLGHTRHFERQEALRRAADSAQLGWRDMRAGNYPYLVVEAPHFRIAEIKADFFGDLPKDSDHRLNLASANPFNGQTQISFLPCFTQDSGEPMLAYVFILNPVKDDDPLRIGFGIPTANLDDWVYLIYVDKLLEAYEEQAELPVQEDKAKPSLKTQPAVENA